MPFRRRNLLKKKKKNLKENLRLEDLARAGHVSCLATKGRNWLAIETTTELEACEALLLKSLLSYI